MAMPCCGAGSAGISLEQPDLEGKPTFRRVMARETCSTAHSHFAKVWNQVCTSCEAKLKTHFGIAHGIAVLFTVVCDRQRRQSQRTRLKHSFDYQRKIRVPALYNRQS